MLNKSITKRSARLCGATISSRPSRFAATTLMLLIVISVFLLPAGAASTGVVWVTDEDDLLTAAAEDSISAIAEKVDEKYGFNIAVVTLKTLGGLPAESVADDIYDSLFSVNSDGILLLICMEYRDFGISTSGSAIWEFEEDMRLDNITDAVVERLSAGDCDSACVTFAKLTESCLDSIRPGSDGEPAVGYDDWQDSYNEIIGDYWVHYQKPDEYDELSFSGIAKALGELSEDNSGYASDYLMRCLKRLLAILAISVVIAFIWVSVMRSGMNNVKKSDRAANYVRKDSFKLTQSSDLYLYSTVTKTPRAQSSSSSGGSRGGGSSHRSSSGGTHGGRSGKFS